METSIDFVATTDGRLLVAVKGALLAGRVDA
jgi:hypothetical protein